MAGRSVTTTDTGLPAQMRAAFIRATGSVENIEVGMLPTPGPGPTDVLIRTEVCGVNHVDLFVRSGAYEKHTPFPFVIGRDLVGTVADVGTGVVDLRIGDRVWCNSLGHAGRQGSFSEYAVAPAERVYPLPRPVDPVTAVAVVHTAATAHVGLVRECGIQPDDVVFVEGASGGVGSAVVQIARSHGARVVATCSAADAESCRRDGADLVLDYASPDLGDRLRRAAPDGIDIWWDTSGQYRFELVLPSLKPRARAVVMAGLAVRSILPVGQLYPRDASLRGFNSCGVKPVVATTAATIPSLTPSCRSI
ncbi:NADPH:quinone reductase [Nocardioides halotolerans]|uniref:NADPH:quinone reductase n=1 Tax=Nocardioides halotolerans TaxID=433660 RepID=UPI000A02F810|nr:NADPH:quinone reductase [Nocardioides halotolerans]